jgi:hypothetical protein
MSRKKNIAVKMQKFTKGFLCFFAAIQNKISGQ